MRSWLIVVIVVSLAIGCGAQTEQRVLTTRLMEGERGVLVERDGCLRLAASLESDAPSRAIVWQKDVFEITRVGDEFQIIDVELGDSDSPVIWNLGDSVTAGGASDFGPPDFHAGEGFMERCSGPYVLISDVQ